MTKAKTLGALKAAGYRSRTVKEELRANLIAALKERREVFPGIIGFEKTVLPQIQNAILSGHDFILLGLRGQAKTRILRSLDNLLDESVPVVEGCEINDDPLAPVCEACRRRHRKLGDDLPVAWLARRDRYREKLATPDVSVADLVGDIDPIKAATRKLSFADPEVIHFGIIPRTNRGIFAINELPDLQARIQVSLLNILEEGDVQIRGFPVRLPMDMLIVFSANPEDYTNRGSIITPLRDRISSQILTHYPRTLEESKRITDQESWSERESSPEVTIPGYLREAVEGVAFQARSSELVDQSSGVSARMSISLLENVISNAERRAFLAGLSRTRARVADLLAATSAITGKIELVYEGEREGVQAVAAMLIGQAVKSVFDQHFPDVFKIDDREENDNPDYARTLEFFKKGGTVDISDELSDDELYQRLRAIPGLEDLARKFLTVEELADAAVAMEFILEALHQHSLLARDELLGGRVYKDMFEDMVRNFRD